MITSDGWGSSLVTDVKVSVLFCTRLPIPHSTSIGSGDVARAGWALPIAGALVGGVGALTYGVTLAIGLPPMLAAATALAATLSVTGCLHEDGLADTADGFGGGADRARKLEIMRDSRLGTYGACAIVMSVVLRWMSIAAIASPLPVALALIGAHTCARAALPAFMHFVSPARPDGLSAQAGRPTMRCAAVAVVLGVLTLGVALGLAATAICLVLAISAGLFTGWLSMRQIGGQTGDVLGTLEQMTEILVLLTAVAVCRPQP